MRNFCGDWGHPKVDHYLKPEPSQQFLPLFKIQRPSEQLKAEKVSVKANIVSRNGNKSCCLIAKINGNFRGRTSVTVLRSEGALYYLCRVKDIDS